MSQPAAVPAARWLSRPERLVLVLWLATRVAVALVAWAVHALGWNAHQQPTSLLARFAHWDGALFLHVAQYGYLDSAHEAQPYVSHAFFPGYPLAIRLVHALLPGFGLDGPARWTLAALLVSLVAGGVAVVALHRLVELYRPGAGPRAVLALLFFPAAFFLGVAYSEALFLALALPAWLAARHRRWWWAGLLAAGASTVRISGLFLALALTVEFLTVSGGLPRSRSEVRALWRRAPALLLGFLPVLAYFGYLYARTGDWLAWRHVQSLAWHRESAAPWVPLWKAVGDIARGDLTAALELGSVLVGVVGTGWLLRRGRWSEAVWVGLPVLALASCDTYVSVPRAALLWWPLFAGLAVWSRRHQWLLPGYLAVSAPVMSALAGSFFAWYWAG